MSQKEVAQSNPIGRQLSLGSVHKWKAALALFGGTLSGVGVFALSQYLTARGFVSVMLARILLSVAWLCLSGLVVLAVKAFEIPKRWVPIVGIVSLTLSLLGLEIWATVSFPFSPPKNSVALPASSAMDSAESKVLDFKRQNLIRLMQSPEQARLNSARQTLRTTLEKVEKKHGCLVDTVSLQCFPRPPTIPNTQSADVTMLVIWVADSIGQSRFWLSDGISRTACPVAVFVRITNHEFTPQRIQHVAIQFNSDQGWQELREAGTLQGASGPGFTGDLLLSDKDSNDALEVDGALLISILPERNIMANESIEGWMLMEYPSGITRGESIGDMRISVLRACHEISETV